MKKHFGSVLKIPAGAEKSRCKYPVRIDTYGCGCFHNCAYCYSKHLLSFRKLWDAETPKIAAISDVARQIRKARMQGAQIVRLGGMTDCFQPIEKM